MSTACKRKKIGNDDFERKKQRIVQHRESPVRRDLLERCSSKVTTLREHILSKLPAGSRLRRKKISSLGRGEEQSAVETQVAHLLDTSLVCANAPDQNKEDTRWEQWISFSQKADESYVSISKGTAGFVFSQSEIVDFVIWLLFSRQAKGGSKPKNLICDGFRRVAHIGGQASTSIPGLFSRHPNSHVKALKEAPWPQLLALLGQSGEKMMIDLLLDYSIFLAISAGFQNYYQLSGPPLSELDLPGSALCLGRVVPDGGRKLMDITLVRSRIFYAKPSLTARGLAQPGFKHIHILNRCPLIRSWSSEEKPQEDLEQRRRTVKVMMYIFPRQFGLHNVFTSRVDSMKTAQKFQDYTVREDEVGPLFQVSPDGQPSRLPKLPKRLRGEAEQLVRRLQILHGRCSYFELLRHYCPCIFDKPRRSRKAKQRTQPAPTQWNRHSQVLSAETRGRQPPKRRAWKQHATTQTLLPPTTKSLLDLATPAAGVSAFCQAVLSKIIPEAFWGDGDAGLHNKSMIMRKVDHFIKLRRFETMSLHEICQDLKINDIRWLQLPGLAGKKPSRTDTNKRHEIFNEFLYYTFDSLLLPLIRCNFYVTESNTHRYQVFYFRHEIWKTIAEPSMATLKEKMFEEVKLDDAMQILQSRRLGFSQVRLLPKGDKLRPIMNLRRRALAKSNSNVLGPSINSILGPVHKFLKFEKDANPSRLGSTLFSVGDIYARLKCFKESLGSNPGKLWFAKVDVQAAFDTIPQAAVIKLMGSIPSQEKYTIAKHAEVKPGEIPMLEGSRSSMKAIRRWHATALPSGDVASFQKRLERKLATHRKHTIFVDGAVKQTHNAEELLALLTEHIEHNLVKVGKKYYRQKIGIPQGSVLSSLLCNYFYADLEMQHLSFLNGPDCLLLRLIDDFLLITLDETKAVKFVNIMHGGLADYGVQVNPKKTLVNFDMEFGHAPVAKAGWNVGFPYCGTLINCQTLDISKDYWRDANLDVAASLTVDYGRVSGQNFQRKVLNAFKILSHLMFFDTKHNSNGTVLNSLHEAFTETARKMWAYIRCLPGRQRPNKGLIIRTIIKVADVAFLLLTGKSRTSRFAQYECSMKKSQVSLIAYCAFGDFLAKKQANFGQVVAWLRAERDRLALGRKRDEGPLTNI